MIGARVVATLGENVTRSIMSRSGRLTCVTAIAAPCADFAGAMSAVSAVVATDAPFELLAVTFARMVWPTSVDVSLYVVAVAPAMSPQPPPVPMQRCH